MSYKIEQTGGVINIGCLKDSSDEVVDVATNIAAITASDMIDTDGTKIAEVVISAITGFDTLAKLVITPVAITDTIATTAWQTPLNTDSFDVVDGAVFQVDDTIQVVDSAETMTITGITNATLTVTRGAGAEALSDSLVLQITNRGSTVNHEMGYLITDVLIDVLDTSMYSSGDTLVTPQGEILTIDYVDTSTAIAVIRGEIPAVINHGDALYIQGLTGTIATGNVWDDYSTRTSFNVTDGTKFVHGDIIRETGSAEDIFVDVVTNDTLTVIRGYNTTTAEPLADGDTITVTNHGIPITQGTQTIVLSSTTDVIEPRNVVVDVCSSEAYDNYFDAVDTTAIRDSIGIIDGNVDSILAKGSIRDRFNTN